jgi:TRAP-type mannitol/chloroaromatic compound transport system permease small subunit
MVLMTLTVVVLRYAFNEGAIVLQESVMYMHGILFMLAIPYGLKQDSHVRVDIVYSRLSARHRSVVDLIGHVVFLLPIALFILITSLPYVTASWRVLEGSSEVGGIPAVFLLKTLIPVMAALLFLQGISEIVKRIKTLTA